MSWPINQDFAEGDSGITAPGAAARRWQQIYEAKVESSSKPVTLKLASIAEIQAKVLSEFFDESNQLSDRLKALELTLHISENFSEELASEKGRLALDATG